MAVAFVGLIIVVGIIFLPSQFVIGPILTRNARRTRTFSQMRARRPWRRDPQHPAAAGAPCRPAQSVHPARAAGRRNEGRPPHRRGECRGAFCHYRLTLTIARV